jgi:multiple antibiotic resistance protein
LPVATRRLVAFGTVAISLTIAVFFVLLGAELVRFFRIDDGAFLFAAGLLVLVFAIRMMLAESPPRRLASPSDTQTMRTRAWQLAAFPLAVPMLITPPAIAALVALSVERDSSIAITAAIAAVLAFDLLVFLAEARWEQVVPMEAWSVAGRLLSVLLAAFGATIMLTGLGMSGLVSAG